jgi:hypothetical protein
MARAAACHPFAPRVAQMSSKWVTLRAVRLLLALLLIVACAKKTQKPDENPPASATPKPADPLPAAPQPTPMAPAAARGQDMKKWPVVTARYSKRLPPGEHLYVTTTLSSPGRTESVFIAVSSIEGSKITGVISSEITTSAKQSPGSQLGSRRNPFPVRAVTGN